MASIAYRAAVFALYQFSLVAAIALLPIALVLGRAGVELPLHHPVERLGTAYERTVN
jgi:hypothetical protein